MKTDDIPSPQATVFIFQYHPLHQGVSSSRDVLSQQQGLSFVSHSCPLMGIQKLCFYNSML